MSEQLLRNINVVKEIFLEALEAEGLLTKPADEIAKQYMIVFARRGWYGSLIDKLFFWKGDAFLAWVVKRIDSKPAPGGKTDESGEPGNRIVEV